MIRASAEVGRNIKNVVENNTNTGIEVKDSRDINIEGNIVSGFNKGISISSSTDITLKKQNITDGNLISSWTDPQNIIAIIGIIVSIMFRKIILKKIISIVHSAKKII